MTTLLLTHLPLLAAALYAVQCGIYASAYFAIRMGYHALWPYLASAAVHGALFACHLAMGH